MFRPELLKKSFSCFGSPVRLFRSESTKGVRFRHRRQSHHPSQILLDKFVKHAKVDASLVVKAPFSLKIKVSSFWNKQEIGQGFNLLWKGCLFEYEEFKFTTSLTLKLLGLPE